ncbi:MAG: mucoidy inhibitor MuiA family protein [Deltaproteobacteria bacterium]|nr:mucoidy inhibitor MuiA family protein [Deltaproteobacteria bacterium]
MKIKNIILVLVLLVLFIFPEQISAKTKTTESKITAVTVFADRALITRTLTTNLLEGTHEIIFDNLPLHLIDGSERVSLVGEEGLKILGTEVTKNFLENTDNKRVKSLEKRLEKLEDEKKLIKSRVRNLEEQRTFIRSIKVKATSDMTEEIERGKPKLGEWQGIVDFYLKNLNNVDTATIAEEQKARELDKKIKDVRNEFYEIRNKNRERGTKKVSVELEQKKAGKVRAELTYAIFGASWQSAYDLRAGGSIKGLELTYYGEVTQNTGEDWKDVKLTLSTARPSHGATAPKLPPWYVEKPVVLGYSRGLAKKSFRSKSKGLLDEPDFAMEEKLEVAKEASPAPLATAVVGEGWTSTTFNIKRRADVLSDGRKKRLTVAIKTFDAEFSYETTPKLSEFAFLKAKIINTAEYPFLPGEASVYVDDNFIGLANLKNIAPSEEAQVSLGIDAGVKIKRIIVKRDKGKSGFISSKLRSTYRYRVEVENFKKEKISITVIDQIPVTRDSAIKVKFVEAVPEFFVETKEDTDKGILKWKLELEPKEKKEITFEFYIDYPKDLVPLNL